MSKKVLACDSYDEGICAYTSRVRVTGISPNDSGLVLTLLVVPYPDLCLESMPSPTCVARSTEAKEEALYVDRGAGSSQKGKLEENGSGGHSVQARVREPKKLAKLNSKIGASELNYAQKCAVFSGLDSCDYHRLVWFFGALDPPPTYRSDRLEGFPTSEHPPGITL